MLIGQSLKKSKQKIRKNSAIKENIVKCFYKMNKKKKKTLKIKSIKMFH